MTLAVRADKVAPLGSKGSYVEVQIWFAGVRVCFDASLARDPHWIFSSYNLDPGFPRSRGEKTTCLIRKSTGGRECHTIIEWREIARKLDDSRNRVPKS